MIRLLTTTYNRGVYTNARGATTYSRGVGTESGRGGTTNSGRSDGISTETRSITTALAHSDVIRSR